MPTRTTLRRVFGAVLPIILAVLILVADRAEGPKTAYVGALTAIPFIAAVFLSPPATLLVGAVTVLLAAGFGAFVATDGNVQAQTVRLGFIAVATIGAAVAAAARQRLEQRAVEALAAEGFAKLAFRDALTDLANRRGAERWIDAAPPADRSVLVCDADRLKEVNDRLGHEVGDAYLMAIAGRLRAGVPSGDLVARWGGDEFVIIMAANADAAAAAAARLIREVHRDPVAVPGAIAKPSLSIGVAPWPAGTDFTAAFRSADTALYEAKASGTGLVATAGG